MPRQTTSYSRELHCSDKYELHTLMAYGHASQPRSDRPRSSAHVDRSAGGETVFCTRAPAADGRHGIALDWPSAHGYNGLGTAPIRTKFGKVMKDQARSGVVDRVL